VNRPAGSANQWLGPTPPEVMAAALNLDQGTVNALRKDKP
jgi:oxalate decarboxylase